MKRSTLRASLNLSVNAIIIFVLAFAMLGVGLLVTKELQSLGMGGIDKAKTLIKNIQEDPTASTPLVGISTDLTIPARKESPLGLKYYNKDPYTIYSPSVNITICKDSSTGQVLDNPVDIVSLSDNIEPSTFQAIPISITNKALVGGRTYICKLEILGEQTQDDPSSMKSWYSYSFNLIVSS
jgi:hypothetical protein